MTKEVLLYIRRRCPHEGRNDLKVRKGNMNSKKIVDSHCAEAIWYDCWYTKVISMTTGPLCLQPVISLVQLRMKFIREIQNLDLELQSWRTSAV